MESAYDRIPLVDLPKESWSEPIPIGPEGLVHGTLPNGVTYYVRKCSKPKQRAGIALVVKVGSVAEEDHEQGIAHILEHLAFNATENYSNHDIVAFLESIGASFGACQNAYTSADETCYTLMIPTDKWELVDKSLAVMAEFAFRIRCSPEDLARERGAVMEEWRMTQDSAGRQQVAHWKLLLEGSKYAERLPIGLKSIIQKVPAAVVKDFHRRWYRPDNVAVVAVGDFANIGDVVSSISKYMAAPDVPAVPEGEAAPPPVPTVPWAPHEEPRYCVFVDREAQDSAVFASFKQRPLNISTAAEFLEHLADSLFQTCLNNRLFRLSRLPDPPFFAASVGDESLCRVVDLAVASAVAEEGCTLRALECMLTEIARVRCHGFSEKEVDKARKSLQAEIESTYLEHDQGYCTEIRDEYVRHFLTGEFVTGQDYEARLSKTLLPHITHADVEARAQAFKHTASAVYKTVEHRKHHTEADMRGVVMKVAAAEAAGEIGPWEEMESPDELMAAPPAVPKEWLEAHQLWLDQQQQQQEGEEGEKGEAGELGTATASTSSSSQEAQQQVGSSSLKGSGKQGLAGGVVPHVGCACNASGGGGEKDHNHHQQQQQENEESGSSGSSSHTSKDHEEQQPSSGKSPPSPSPAAAAANGGTPPSPGISTEAAPDIHNNNKKDSSSNISSSSSIMRGVGVIPSGGLPAMLAPGVVGQRTYPHLQATELLLVNGMRVCLKETDFFKDEVLISGVATGGLSEVPRDQFLNASMSTVIAAQLGVFGFKPEVQNEILAGKRCELSPSEGAYSRCFKGSASPADLKEALQLVHLLMTTRVSVVESDLGSVMVQVRQGVEAQLRNPLFHYHNQVRLINYGSCYYFEPITLDDLAKLDPYAACAHHISSFSNPSEITLVLTGHITLPLLLPLISTYLATIPPVIPPPPPPARLQSAAEQSKQQESRQQQQGEEQRQGQGQEDQKGKEGKQEEQQREEQQEGQGQEKQEEQEKVVEAGVSGPSPWYLQVHPHRGLSPLAATPLPFSFPEAPVVEDVEVDMVSPITQSQLTFPVSLTRTTAKEELVWTSLMCRLLETRLLQMLRFRFGNVYTVSVAPFFGCEAPSHSGPIRGDVSIAFTCDPANKAKLVDMALGGLEQLQQEVPTAQEIETLRTLEQLEWENSQQENSFWHDMMAMSYQSRSFAQHQDLDRCYLATVKAREAVMADLSPDTLREACRRLLPCPCRSRYTAITMMPQKPNLLQRLAFRCSSFLARFTAGGATGDGEAAAAAVGGGRGVQLQRSVSRAGSGRLAASADVAGGVAPPVAEDSAAAAAAAMGPGGLSVAGAGAMEMRYGSRYFMLGGVAVVTAAVALGAVMWVRSKGRVRA